MFLKRTDLDPLYKEPIFAEVQFLVTNNSTEYISKNNCLKRHLYDADILYEIWTNIYLHNRLQQYDADAKVDNMV